MIIRPATPGFLVTLIATVLLAVVSFSVPWFKSVYFLRATVDLNGHQGVATFGVLGYCLNVGGNVNCTSPRVGYEFDPNSLLGNNTPIQIPQVVVKWLTYALVLHIIALGFAAGSAVFGLLAHIREFSMTCCSTCISGFGASIALLAFIFDVAFFFLFKARINKVPGGSAQTGNAIWLTLTATLLLLFAGCFYGFGRCCISTRSRGPRDKNDSNPAMPGAFNTDSEALRLDAVKTEADRKARQKQGEVGLPAFNEYDPSKPLTSKYDEEDEPYMDHPSRQASAYSSTQAGGGGYVPNNGYSPAAPGTSAMDAYYNTPAPPQVPPAVAAYPPQPTTHPSTEYNAYNVGNAQPTRNQYPSSGTYGHGHYASNEGAHGHSEKDTSYYTTASQYQPPPHVPEPSSYHAQGYVPSSDSAAYTYSSATTPGVESAYVSSSRSTAYTSSSTPNTGVESAYNTAPPMDFLSGIPSVSTGRDDYAFSGTKPALANPSSSGAARQSPGPRGPRSPTTPTMYGQSHSDNPPEYEPGHMSNTVWPNDKKS